MTIGLLLVSTGKYDVFLPELLEQVDRLFFPNDKVEVFLFTDKFKHYIDSKRVSVTYIRIEHKPFPFPTLYRFRYINSESNSIKAKCDYVFYMDVDMRIVETIGHEILSNGVIATQHCGFIHGGWGSLNVDPQSKAFVPFEKRGVYCAGGFQGGKTDAYMDMVNVLDKNISEDENNGIIAEYHDESHFNNYLSYNEHTIISHEYCMGEAYISGTPKIIALDKNHAEIRS